MSPLCLVVFAMFRVYIEAVTTESKVAEAGSSNVPMPTRSHTLTAVSDFPLSTTAPTNAPTHRSESTGGMTGPLCNRALHDSKPLLPNIVCARIYAESVSTRRPTESATTASTRVTSTPTVTRLLRQSQSHVSAVDKPVEFTKSLRGNRQFSHEVKVLKNAPVAHQPEPGNSGLSLLSFSKNLDLRMMPPIKETEKLVARSYLQRTQERARSLKRGVASSPRKSLSVRVQGRSCRRYPDWESVASSCEIRTFRSQGSDMSGLSRRSVKLKEPTDTGMSRPGGMR